MNDLKLLLDSLAARHENPGFIPADPISIPHRFSKREDVEIAAFLAATLAWGRRDIILRSAGRLLELMEQSPYDFTMHATPAELSRLSGFQHRTFSGEDAVNLVYALRSLYQTGGLEPLFAKRDEADDLISRISRFREALTAQMPRRTHRHVADMRRGSAAKRLNMFLRWMVRSSERGVDFGLWTSVSPSELLLPLDVHAASASRKLGILTRKSNDSRAVEEVTAVLRGFCPEDPVKYDFALFSMEL